MSKKAIRKEIQKLQRTIDRAPKILRFHGKRVVPCWDWKYGDWSRLPDAYHIIAIVGDDIPKDWRRDYIALLEKLKDPDYAKDRCYYCAIYKAQELKKQLDRQARIWDENGGPEAKQKFYKECGEPKATEFVRQDAMKLAEWRLYNEAAEANNRTCNVVDYFKCPYGQEWRTLTKDGLIVHRLWAHIRWYDHHWNRNTTIEITPSERKWFHFGEAAIINVGDFEDIINASEDGRLDRIIEEHEKYMKETNRKPWDL
jgi:hypothetical protein